MYDVVIIGAGPAGLSAALLLGRCRRRVFLCDSGTPRNAASRELHGYLTRDGVSPLELLRLGREELRAYGIETQASTVTALACVDDGFEVALDTQQIRSRTVLIASGVRDRLPDVPGIRDCYGITVHHCPYCDGWEVRDCRLVIYGRGRPAASLALSLKTWTAHVTICTDGGSRIAPRDRARLAGQDISIKEERIECLEHERGHAKRVVLRSGGAVACDALFFATGQRPQSHLARQLGCAVTKTGIVKTDRFGQTRVPGLYVAGDASRDVQFAIVAAAEGAKAAVAINKALQARVGLAVESATRIMRDGAPGPRVP